MAGTQVGGLVQDTTTSTGTGAITLANTVPAGAQAGSITFATQFAPGAVFPVSNIFYAIIDASGNVEVGLGTLTSATNLTRDYILAAYTAGNISPAGATQGGTHVNFAAGTKQVFSNANIFALSQSSWVRIPDDNTANIFNAIMSGTFTGVITNTGTANVTVRFKVTNEGMVILSIPTAASVTNAATGPVTVTGIPAFLSNVNSPTFSTFGVITLNGANACGVLSVAPGANPTATGVATLFNLASVSTLSSTVTTATAQGFPAGSSFTYPLF